MDRDLKHRVNAGRVAVRNQIDFFKHQFGRVESEWKEDQTRVTFADYAISERIFEALRESFPKDDFCSEESNPEDEIMDLRATHTWVLDPVDGTNNYAAGVPTCAISLGLLRNGHPVYGFVYDYSRDQLIQGGPGAGLFDGCNKVDRKLEPLDAHSVLALNFPWPEDKAQKLLPLLTRYRARSMGSGTLNLAYVAIGLIDAALDYRVKIWDIAAGMALAAAAGLSTASLGDPIFPLTRFHPRLPETPYCAGDETFCRDMVALLKESAAVVER